MRVTELIPQTDFQEFCLLNAPAIQRRFKKRKKERKQTKRKKKREKKREKKEEYKRKENKRQGRIFFQSLEHGNDIFREEMKTLCIVLRSSDNFVHSVRSLASECSLRSNG